MLHPVADGKKGFYFGNHQNNPLKYKKMLNNLSLIAQSRWSGLLVARTSITLKRRVI